jgi:hypothetical protein
MLQQACHSHAAEMLYIDARGKITSARTTQGGGNVNSPLARKAMCDSVSEASRAEWIVASRFVSVPAYDSAVT